MRAWLLAALFVSLPATASVDRVCYVYLVNDAKSSVVSFEAAPTKSQQWVRLPIGEQPLAGGGAATMLGIRKGTDCLHDFRIAFADGRVLIQRGFDICRFGSFHPDFYLRHSQPVRDGEPEI
ncbi:hypothetical protein SAMN05216570_0611 [Dyella sp. OK004]|uniref:hypothetical protein n=1 Tax=Dyella sp. OK004 TaxID=1855292 RepID=UPI0008EF0182|nr:hypothetical protein [Dyella sp. OK004]SFR91823.1 hypothetical protein SAMN05216570_0611 [Dyella sp. OK004]